MSDDLRRDDQGFITGCMFLPFEATVPSALNIHSKAL